MERAQKNREAKEKRAIQKEKEREAKEDQKAKEQKAKQQMKASQPPVDKKKLSQSKGETIFPFSIRIGNTHQLLQEAHNSHEWKMFVDLVPNDRGKTPGVTAGDLIEKVVFDLHPTFTPQVVTVSKAPFELTRTGWGTFDVRVIVFWKPAAKTASAATEWIHELSFENDQTSRVVPIPSIPGSSSSPPSCSSSSTSSSSSVSDLNLDSLVLGPE